MWSLSTSFKTFMPSIFCIEDFSLEKAESSKVLDVLKQIGKNQSKESIIIFDLYSLPGLFDHKIWIEIKHLLNNDIASVILKSTYMISPPPLKPFINRCPTTVNYMIYSPSEFFNLAVNARDGIPATITYLFTRTINNDFKNHLNELKNLPSEVQEQQIVKSIIWWYSTIKKPVNTADLQHGLLFLKSLGD